MSVDTVGDFLTIIRNALMVSKRSAVVNISGKRIAIAKVLKDEGYIKDYQVVDGERGRSKLKLVFKYVDGKPAIQEITRISTPGRRHYEGIKNLTRVIGGLGISILTTNKGVITDLQARKLSVGGEVLCHVW